MRTKEQNLPEYEALHDKLVAAFRAFTLQLDTIDSEQNFLQITRDTILSPLDESWLYAVARWQNTCGQLEQLADTDNEGLDFENLEVWNYLNWRLAVLSFSRKVTSRPMTLNKAEEVLSAVCRGQYA